MARAWRAVALWVLGLLAVSALLRPAALRRSFCNPDVAAQEGHPLAYRDRGDRCEGIYTAKIGSFGLVLASFTGPLAGVGLRGKPALGLAWAPRPGEVQIEVASLRDDIHYRMDTVQAGSAGSFSWPAAIPSRYALEARDLGILATVSGRTGPRRVYLPLRVQTSGSGGALLPYRIVVVPGVRCDEIYWSLNNGQRALVIEKKLDRGPYLPGVPVSFELDSMAKPGSYRLSLAARLHGGGSEVLDVNFEHRPP